MCLDISFKIEATEDSLYDYLPHLKIDPQLTVEFDNLSHIQAHDRPKTRIIYTNKEGFPYLTLMRWGLMQRFMTKDPFSFKKYANSMFNARAENIFDTKSVWNRIRTNRCLIVAPGIYEHRHIAGWKNKVPYYIRLKSRKTLLIPALYSFMELNEEDIKRIKATNDKQMIEAVNKTINFETGEITGTYAMITRQANELMKNIHNDGPNKHRMPLFMSPEQAVQWIDPALSDAGIKEILDYEIPAEELEAWPVFTIRSQKPRPDNKEKYEPFHWPGLPELGIDEAPAPKTLFG